MPVIHRPKPAKVCTLLANSKWQTQVLKKYTHTKKKKEKKKGLTCAKGKDHTEKQTHLHLDAHPHKLYTCISVSHQVINISIFLSSFCQQPAGLGKAISWKQKTSLPSILEVKKRKSNCVKTENLTAQWTQGGKKAHTKKACGNIKPHYPVYSRWKKDKHPEICIRLCLPISKRTW